MNAILRNTTLLALAGMIPFQSQLKAADAEIPHETRLKWAKKPYNIARYYHFTVENKENEEAFLKLFRERLAVRQYQADNGKFQWFALFKARNSDYGSNYVISLGMDALRLGGVGQAGQKPDLPESFSQSRWEETWSQLQDVRTYDGVTTLALRDFTTSDPNVSKWPDDPRDIVLTIDYMKAAPGKKTVYRDIEQEVFQKVWQKRLEIDPSFVTWRFLEVIGNDVQTMEPDYVTVNVSRSDVTLAKERSHQIWAQVGEGVGKDLGKRGVKSMDDLRQMRSVTYDWIMGTEVSTTMKQVAKREIVGSWIHKNKDGSSRKKVITPFTEQLTFYNAKGEIVQKRKPIPLRIEVINQQKRFTAYFPDGSTWNAAIDLIDGKLYEQHRAIRNGKWTKSNPRFHWVYERSE